MMVHVWPGVAAADEAAGKDGSTARRTSRPSRPGGLVVEEIARGWMSVSGVINTHFIVAYMILQHGTEEQKQRYLPRMATGEIRGAFSMSEPALGSDVSAIRTKAVRQGDTDEWVIDGQKMWLTNGGSANLVAVLVRTELGEKSVYKNKSPAADPGCSTC